MSAPLLEVENLGRQFVARRSALGRPTAIVTAVEGVSFSLAAGKTLALVGESGSGKSTLGRLVLRLIDPTTGRIRFDGRDVTTLKEHELRPLRRHAQLIFQDPYASLNPRMTVGRILAEPLALHEVVPSQRRAERVNELLRLVGLEPRMTRNYPHEFSGGQRQRIAIARALAVEPKLIVCDEPVSALDVSIGAQVLNLLREVQRRLGLAYIFISHDLAVVKHVADHIAVMHLGRIVELAPNETLFADPGIPIAVRFSPPFRWPIREPSANGSSCMAKCRARSIRRPVARSIPAARSSSPAARPSGPNSLAVSTQPHVTAPASCRRRRTSFHSQVATCHRNWHDS
jgi:ABC-type glutathione transport system ATPase component